jgi:predicted dehydrogenase
MIRLATIGTSSITRHFARAVDLSDGIQIGCVYSRDPGRARALADDLGVAATASDLPRMLASPDIDAVYIASPNSEHGVQARAAIDAGKHVLVEKPAVTGAAEWADLVGSATGAGVVLLEGIRNEYDPGMTVVRDSLPRLGVVRRVSLRYEKRSARYDLVLAGERVNMFDPVMAGGALMDLGVYCAHALVTLFGSPQRVVAAAVPVRSGVDGAGAALAVYPGFVADLSYSKITTSVLPSEIQGEQATLLIDHIASPRTLTLQYGDGTSEQLVVPGPPHGLVDEVRRFVQLVEAGDDPAQDHARTHQTLQIIDAIRTGQELRSRS